MTPHGESSITASVRQRLINISKQKGEDPNLVFNKNWLPGGPWK
jgi:hypothetical protein